MRVLNVDSQASFDNILVSVIGEISNKSEPSRKFIQTFVLAEQPNGYYVLNDIFRYLADEQEEIVNEVAATPAVEPDAPKAAEPVPAAEAQVTDEAAVSKVDEKLEPEVNGEAEQPEPAPQTNGTPAQEEAPAPAPAVEADLVKNEKPPTPESTPAPEQKDVPAEKESAPAPSLPKTWANIASKPGAPAPVIPAIPAAAPKTVTPAASAPQPAAAAAAAVATAPAAGPVTESRSQDTGSSDSAGWQTAGAEHKKTQSRAGEELTVLGYIKNVTDKVDANLLKQTLTRFGKLKYFDVSRAKVCELLILPCRFQSSDPVFHYTRTALSLNSPSPLATLLLSPPTRTRSAANRSLLKSAAPVAMPMVATATALAEAVLAAAVVTVQAAKAVVASSAMAGEVSPLVVVAAMLPPRAAARPKLLELGL